MAQGLFTPLRLRGINGQKGFEAMSAPVTNRELVIFGIAVVAVAVAITQYVMDARAPVWQHMRPGFGEGWRGHGGGGFGGPRGERMGGPGGGFMAMADRNKDGFITKDELMNGARTHIDEMFDVMDTDKDGKLSREELVKGRDLMRQRMWAKFEAERKASAEALPADEVK